MICHMAITLQRKTLLSEEKEAYIHSQRGDKKKD